MASTALYQIWAGTKQKELGAGSMQVNATAQPAFPPVLQTTQSCLMDADIEFTVEGSRKQHVAANHCGIRKDFYETLHA